MLSKEHKDLLGLFNEVADELINSEYIEESRQRLIGETFRWQADGNNPRQMNFDYTAVRHNENNIKALILTLRKVTQKDDDTYLGKLVRPYHEMQIDGGYKNLFQISWKYLNYYMGRPMPIVSINNEPTRQQVFDTFVYGKYAHNNERERQLLKVWKTQQPDWDMMYYQFDLILKEHVNVVSAIKKLNEIVLEKYA